MQVATGSIIISTTALEGSIFERSIIVIAEKNELGATGFIVNQLLPQSFNHLEEFKNYPSFPLYNGGPVEQEGLFFLHRIPDLIHDGIQVKDQVFLGGNFEDALELIHQQSSVITNIKLFIGYCGWDAGELEAEIEEGSWIVTNALVEQIFETTNTFNWQLLYSASIKK